MNVKKRLLTAVLSAGLIFSVWPAAGVGAANSTETDTSLWQTCTTYEGTNVEKQDYSVWTSPITSYLTPCGDGKLMRVQSGGGVSGKDTGRIL